MCETGHGSQSVEPSRLNDANSALGLDGGRLLRIRCGMDDSSTLDGLFQHLAWMLALVAALGIGGFLILLLGVRGTEQITRQKFRQGLLFLLVLIAVLAGIVFLYFSS